MNIQPYLFDWGLPAVDYDATPTTRELFERFHREHPEVMQYFVQLAEVIWACGFRHYAIRVLFEVVRWHFDLEWGPERSGEFKLNNNYLPHYARRLVEENPKFADFFEFRACDER